MLTETHTTRQVPYVDIVRQHALLKGELLEAVSRVLDHGQFVLGPEVEQFERKIAHYCGARHAVGLNSGTDALVLGLRALGVGPGDEVLTPPNSFVATTSAIRIVGATPVFVDAGCDMNINVELIRDRITPRTRAILPVHLTGRPAAMRRVMTIARGHGLSVIEDAAQAIGAGLDGQHVGTFGDCGCFSLHPLKTLNACGDGGVLVTNRDDLAQRVRLMRNLGLESRENCVEWSGNSRLDTIQAAMLLVKMEHLDGWAAARRKNACFYRDALADIEGLELPSDNAGEFAVYHTFIVQTDRRDELKDYLHSRGIGTAIHYPRPIHLQDAAVSLGFGAGSFPVAERQSRRILSLPIYPELDNEQLDYVASCVRAFFRK
ncbi:MAG: aminotransferase class I/II-fold pyridoxal phosphate-dependent enzyme [Phycisphaera sp.]|nr:aminotransferase class I/II-fold pyridoxal phosphate-dependent enzyme [Phycisphaera sp.]